jgi:hypothetical protein
MQSHWQISRFILCLSGLLFTNATTAFPTGAPVQHTGARGEPDCSNCHFGELGSSPPTLRLEALDSSVSAGSQQMITFLISHPDLLVAGIQLSLRTIDDLTESAGDLYSQQLKAETFNKVVYLNHIEPIPALAGTARIQLQWNVSEVVGKVVFNAALVAGNNDNSPFGDSVMTLEHYVNIISD